MLLSRKILLLGGWVFATLLPPISVAQKERWEELNTRVLTLKDEGKYAEALPLAQDALRVAEATWGPQHLAVSVSLNNLGLIYLAEGKYREAVPLYQRALKILEGSQGPDGRFLAFVAGNLAILYSQQGNYADAEPLFQRALKIEESIPASGDPHFTRFFTSLLSNFAGLYARQGKYAEAELLYKRALTTQEKAQGPEYAAVLNNLGSLYSSEGRYADAERILQRASGVVEKSLGPDHPDLAAVLNNLAELCETQAKYAEAERLINRVLAIREKALGPDHPDVAISLNNLGAFYEAQGDHADAEPLYQRALSILEKALGPDHPEVANPLSNLALLYRHENKYVDAERLFQRALSIDEKALGPENPHVADGLDNLAGLYSDQGRYSDAEPLYQRALKIREKALGPDHPDVANSLNNLGVLYAEQGKDADAEQLYQRALSILEKALGPDSPQLVSPLNNLANIQWRRQDPDAAEAYFERSRAILVKLFDQAFAYMSEKERLSYLADFKDYLPVYFSFCYRYRDQRPELIGKMYDLLLWEKGMVASSVAAQRARLVASGDSQALALLDQLTSKKNQLAALELVQAVDPGHQRKKIDELQGEANDLEKELTRRVASFGEDKKQARPTWQQVRQALRHKEAAVEFVRFRFNDGMKWTDQTYYAALVLTPTPAKSKWAVSSKVSEVTEGPTLIPLGEWKDLKGAMDDYRQHVLLQGELASKFGIRFYQAFWKPLEPTLSGVKRAYVSPDGILNQVSWAAIPNENGRLLIEGYDVRVVSSTKDLLRDIPRTSSRSAVLIGNPTFDLSESEQRTAVAAVQANGGHQSFCPDLGKQSLPQLQTRTDITRSLRSTNEQHKPLDPLPRTQKELESSRDIFEKRGWRVEIYCQQGALEEVVKGVKSPRVLHLATHGFFEPVQDWSGREGEFHQPSSFQDPMLRSGLYFVGADRTRAGDPGSADVENGVLTAYEATGLTLQGTELVVLSACETGLGQVESGEGIFGLRRALQEARAEAVLMSMWKVPDRESLRLVTLFYKKWLSGKDKHDALREAEMELRKELIKKDGVDVPHRWAAFVLVGR